MCDVDKNVLGYVLCCNVCDIITTIIHVVTQRMT